MRAIVYARGMTATLAVRDLVSSTPACRADAEHDLRTIEGVSTAGQKHCSGLDRH